MKFILIFLFFLIFSSNEKEYVIIDIESKELLTGVKVETEDGILYSDFDGKISTKSEIKNIEYISYELSSFKNDTIFLIKNK
jgi:malate/lactate dehydrogenase